jgi:hypothetical protein
MSDDGLPFENDRLAALEAGGVATGMVGAVHSRSDLLFRRQLFRDIEIALIISTVSTHLQLLQRHRAGVHLVLKHAMHYVPRPERGGSEMKHLISAPPP